jgi:hypothetical protein
VDRVRSQNVQLFAAAQDERRAVVTENISNFSVIANPADQRGQSG